MFESIVLVRLPPTGGLDIEENGFGVSGGGEKGFCKSCWIGGDAGGGGKGFSLLRLLVLLACLAFEGDRGDSLSAEYESGEGVAALSLACKFVGICLPPDIDPSLRMPFRTPARKSPFSSSSLRESDAVKNLEESSAPIGYEVNSSDMINHT